MRTFRLSSPLTVGSPGGQLDVDASVQRAYAVKVALTSAIWNDGDYIDVYIDCPSGLTKYVGRYWRDETFYFSGPVKHITFSGNIAGADTSVMAYAVFMMESAPRLVQRSRVRITTADAGLTVTVPVPRLGVLGCTLSTVVKGTWTAGFIDSIVATRDGVDETLHAALIADGVLSEWTGFVDSLVVNVDATFDGSVDVMFTFSQSEV